MLKIFLILVFSIVFLSCNQQKGNREASKDEDKNAMLVENARVEGEEPQSVEDFVKEATSGGMMEVELGQYAEQNALNPRVKNFGAMMVRDHSRANDELKSIAAGKNISVPSTMEDNHMNKVNDLKKESGTDFDTRYIREMVDDHEKDVDKFKKQAENGKDPEIKAFAAKTLEILLIHQDSARQIRDALNN